MLLSFRRFNLLNFWPSLTKILFRKRWEELFRLRRRHESVLVPLIRARKSAKQESLSKDREEFVVSYVEHLLDLELPDEKRKLEEGEMVSLCAEFLDAGTDTTSTALQWIMANLVKYPRIQEKLFEEIQGVVDAGQEEIREDDLHKMPYLKAVVLEGLRRHPPGHFVLPHAVTQDTILDGFRVPKNGSVNFMVAEMGWDAKVWEDPMMFKPERFMNSDNSIDVEAFDITGSKEIKMMPFGAGRRFVPANLIWDFKWVAVDGDSVDLSEKQEFTVVMKNPLEPLVSRRERARVGKVHGSLARAGKVRGQTPKVAKQDKKKKPRGRAHKRMQYNRRFVTAVVGFGKKRGPNSSEK
uniref:40S ribosomal protein S30 n=1 Tax=Salix viminalis TaxID=40686 RepID=A0A6N2N144_SALVM